jgi:hypothetical protein
MCKIFQMIFESASHSIYEMNAFYKYLCKHERIIIDYRSSFIY